ncbi:MAG: UbiD family decarboxylase [Deltaproteobacteria bacterium]|nr:UbiD family decarboxylase [Deltaproteobacteria bacterium]
MRQGTDTCPVVSQKLFRDFREVLEYFETHGRLMRIKQEVGLDDYKISSAVRSASDTDGPAFLFENIKGCPGWRIAAGVYANRRNVALSLGIEEKELRTFFLERMLSRIPPRRVSCGPVKEVILKGEEVNLLALPIPVHAELDRGHLINGYVSGDLLIGRVPDTSMCETAMVRMTPLSLNTISVWRGGGHLRQLMNEAEAKGKGMELAAVIGFEPSFAYASQLFNPMGTLDELELCGGFRGGPVELVKCETIDVEVPANSEIVLEMVCIPGERVSDGPYGEFHGTYGGSPAVAVAKVTAITMRRDPIYCTVMTGVPPTENHWIKGPGREAMAWANAKRTGVDVVDVYLPPGGAYVNQAIISIRKRHEEDPRVVMMAMLSSGRGVNAVTRVTVVDDDIDVRDPKDVDWAIMNRCEPDLDVIIIPGYQSYEEARQQHSTGIVRPGVRGAKWGIDATAPLKGKWAYQKVYVPGQAQIDWRKGEQMWDGVDLKPRPSGPEVIPERHQGAKPETVDLQPVRRKK